MSDITFAPCRKKMVAEGLPAVAIAAFEQCFDLIAAGETGMIAEAQIEPIDALPDSTTFVADDARLTDALSRTVVIKLNGGLGTSMGMSGAKTLLPVKGESNFLDIIAGQLLTLRARYGCRLPLVFMNSFTTRADTLAHMRAYPDLKLEGLPLDFLQHKVPRLRCDDLRPLEWPDNPDQEWCPPGHGDLYTALVTSGMLGKLLEQDFEYAFVSNGDNLGAVLDPRILVWFAGKQLPFAMEVADRTESDKKGGHLARLRTGGLTLREVAQCPDAEVDAFQDFLRYRYFNTNNLWLNLRRLDAALTRHEQVLPLPLIRNQKHAEPSDKSSPAVYQAETAMGAAISLFEDAAAVRVGRERFAPVKTTCDLLLLWSDRYVLDGQSHVRLNPSATAECVVSLDVGYFADIGEFQKRFAHGAPSLSAATRFDVCGDVSFGRDVVVRGAVKVEAAPGETRHIADSSVLEG